MWQEIIVWGLFMAIIGYKAVQYLKPKKTNTAGCGCGKCDLSKGSLKTNGN